MKTSDKGIAFLAGHEGVVPAPYLDSVGVWTYGVGHTAAAGAPIPSKMARGMPADLDAALGDVFALFRRDLAKYEADVNRVLAGRTVPQHEFDAAVSFHFNTGSISHANWVDLWLAGKVREAGDNMLANWRKPAEIVGRRSAERALLVDGSYGAHRASVWPVSEAGRITWKPVRTLTHAQILALMTSRGVPVSDARPPSKPTPAITGQTKGLVYIIAALAAAALAYLGVK